MATYYIGATGNNANPGTAASPKSLSYLGSLVAGDTALLLGGTYYAQAKIYNRVGTAANPIVIKAANSTPVILDGGWDGVTWPTLYTGANYTNMYRFSALVDIVNCQYVEISEIIVKNSSGEGINITKCRNVTLSDFEVYRSFGAGLITAGDNSAPGTWYGPIWVRDGYMDDVVLSRAWFHQTAPDGTYVATVQGAAPINDYIDDATYERITIKKSGGQGLQADRNTKYVTLRDCIVVDSINTGYYFQCTRNAVMERCLAYATDSYIAANGREMEGFTFMDEPGSLAAPYNAHTSQNDTMRNCIAVNCKHGFRFGSGATMVNHLIENCTFVNCGRPFVVSPINPDTPRATPSGNIVRNNLFFNDTVAGSSAAAYAAGFTFRNNLFFGSTVPANANGTGTLTSNPLLSSPGAPYTYPLNVAKFRPTSTSPAIDASLANGLLLDYTKLARVGTPDIGALEFTTATTAPVANFTANQTSGNAPLVVNFTDTSTPSTGNTITSRTWQYSSDNGATWTTFSTAQNPTYTFPAGCYQVRLTVTDSGGGSNTKTMTGA